MYKCKNFALTALGMLMLSSSAFSEERRVIRPDDIRTPLVPTAHIGGDRDFGGNGPNITITVDVLPGNQGRTLVANVTFHAKETKPDHSEVVGRWSNIVIHTLPGDLRISRIAGETHTRLTHRSSRGATPGSSTVTLGRTEDGGVIVTKTPQRQGQVRAITFLGDTTGDDISDDQNPHGDTSIRAIAFRNITIFTKQAN